VPGASRHLVNGPFGWLESFRVDHLAVFEVGGDLVDHCLSNLVGLLQPLDLNVKPLDISVFGLDLEFATPDHFFEDFNFGLLLFDLPKNLSLVDHRLPFERMNLFNGFFRSLLSQVLILVEGLAPVSPLLFRFVSFSELAIIRLLV